MVAAAIGNKYSSRELSKELSILFWSRNKAVEELERELITGPRPCISEPLAPRKPVLYQKALNCTNILFLLGAQKDNCQSDPVLTRFFPKPTGERGCKAAQQKHSF